MQQKFTQNYPPFKLTYLCIFGPLLAWLDRTHHGNQTCAESKHQLQYQADFTLVSRIIAGDLSRISRTQSSQYNRPWVCMSFWISWTWNYPYMVCCNVHAWAVLLDMLEEVQWASLISALWKSGSDSKQERSWKNSFPRKLHWGENQPNLNMILFSNVVKGNLIWSHHHINILTTICLK